MTCEYQYRVPLLLSINFSHPVGHPTGSSALPMVPGTGLRRSARDYLSITVRLSYHPSKVVANHFSPSAVRRRVQRIAILQCVSTGGIDLDATVRKMMYEQAPEQIVCNYRLISVVVRQTEGKISSGHALLLGRHSSRLCRKQAALFKTSSSDSSDSVRERIVQGPMAVQSVHDLCDTAVRRTACVVLGIE